MQCASSLHLSSVACTPPSTGPVPSEADKSALRPGTARYHAPVPGATSWDHAHVALHDTAERASRRMSGPLAA